MNDSVARRWFSYLIVLIPVGVLLYALVNQTQEIPKPKSVKGEIDLSQWDFVRNGSVRLNGDWIFAWKENPVQELDFNAALAEGTPMPVPGIWNGKTVGNEKLSAFGYGSYRLKVFLPESAANTQVGMSILTMSNAYQLYINRKLVATSGVVGESEESSVPQYKPRVITFVPDTNVLDIKVCISNFDHCKGGFWLPIELGDVQQVQHDRDARVLLEMFLFGCLFIMALYHFGLYVLRKNDSTTLFFGLMCAVISIRSLLTGEVLMNHIFPGMDWHLARKIEYILTFTSAPIYVTFCRKLFPGQWNKILYRSIVGFGMALCLFVLVTPTEIFTNASYVFSGYAWITGMITIYIFIKAFRKKLEGAGIFLATTLFFLLTIVNDTLNQLELVHTGLYLSFGLLIVTFAQSFSLSSRFSNAFFTTEMYASTFRKFVPSQFLDRIAKDGIQSIKPGNAEKAEVTVLFSDIRSFTTLAETMTPDEVFSMLNKYLAHVEPPIRANHG
ncbi:MAG TPA: 7TM diverse intracellular signaling domain-containing protein, partial [Bacteroidia bacterium]|nr:7TM diverse intracellular signaling domain-containing protein [Bacteroidia bacterium]